MDGTEKDAGRLVSVLMVVRNERESIGEAIGSVLRQTHRALELLVVDGCSTDGTPAIVEKIAATDGRVRLLRNAERIIPAGLNIGLAAARGDYIARLDGHSRWNDTYLADALDALAERPDAAGVGGRRNGSGVGTTGRAIALALASRLGVGNSVYHYGTEPQDTDHATCGVYRSAAARAVGGWDEELAVNEDVDFDHRLREAGHAILFDPRLQTEWRVRESVSDFFRQYRRYGRGKAAMVRKNGIAAVRARHLTAPALVVGLAGSAVAAVAGRGRLAAVTPAVYAAAIGLGVARTLQGTPRTDTALAAPLATAFAAMHVGWGIGFLEGLLLRRAPAAASAREPRRTFSVPGRRTPRRRS